MEYFPENNILTTNAEYVPLKSYGAGRPISIEISGVFAGATVALGFASADTAPVFIADVTSAGAAITRTSAGRWFTNRPASGRPALKITEATGTTAILVKIIDLPR